MRPAGLEAFAHIWAVDFEYSIDPGGVPRPICMSALDLRSRQLIQLWEDDLRRRSAPPFPVNAQNLYVGYMTSAEFGCHLALGWPLPISILDPYVEFRHLLNGTIYEAVRRKQKGVKSLLGALLYFGLNAFNAEEKDEMRQLALRGGPWTPEERAALLAYNASDVYALEQIFPKLMPTVNLLQALQRGRYMKAVAHMERAGIPVDTALLEALQCHRRTIEDQCIAAINPAFHVYDGRTFKIARFDEWLDAHGIRDWPRTATGILSLQEAVFEEMGQRYPAVAPLGQLRYVLDKMKVLDGLHIGPDGRARCLLSPFLTLTSRTHPSTTEYLFFLPAWLRRLMRPEPGRALIYCDYGQQEFGIAAHYSEDPAMIEAYSSGDPYLQFAIQAGAAPQGATKQTHGEVRELFKVCSLAMLYGMGAPTLARRLGRSVAFAQQLLNAHKRAYPRFWRWLEDTILSAIERGSIQSVFGWTYRTEGQPDLKKLAKTLANYPMQSGGAEMIRLAACYLTEQGVTVCGTVHDALLVECALADIARVAELTQRAMAYASAKVLRGYELRTDVTIIRYPERYMDARGDPMWHILRGTLADVAPQVVE